MGCRVLRCKRMDRLNDLVMKRKTGEMELEEIRLARN